MALINCPKCGNNISDKAIKCIHCGFDMNDLKNKDENTVDSSVTIPQSTVLRNTHMKQLKCEMCGGTDLIKHDGLFVCQSCGIKYSVEDAKKLMIDGPVDVSGSVIKIDNSGSIDNYLKMAERAYESSNNKETENYCNRIIEIEPNNYKALLLKGKAAGWQSTLANPRVEEAAYCFSEAMNNAPDEETDSVKEEINREFIGLSNALMKMRCNSYAEYPSEENATKISNTLIYLYNCFKLIVKTGLNYNGYAHTLASFIDDCFMVAWKNEIWPDYWGDGHPSDYDLERFMNRATYARSIIKSAIIADSDYDKRLNIPRYQNLIYINNRIMEARSYTYDVQVGGYVTSKAVTVDAQQKYIDEIMGWHWKIKEIDPSYIVPQRPAPVKSGCYIATAVYGSYDCPEVWTLRRYRDFRLAETWYGRLFIHVYYALSPTMVKWFGKKNWFQKMWKKKLDRKVCRLQKKGYESTPYEDRNWK